MRGERWLAPAVVLLVGCGGSNEEQPPKTERAPAVGRPARVSDDLRAPGVRLTAIGTFASPVHVAQPPGDDRRLFVVEKGGRVRVIRGGRKLKRPFLSVRGRITRGTEQGLLSLAFARDYERSRRLFISYTDRRGDLRVVRYLRSRRSPERVDRSSKRLVLRVRMDRAAATHNGGHLAFGPRDGLLYIGVGDGGGPGDPKRRAQNRASLRGKILRIDPRRTRTRRYRVPRSNPFVRTRGARDEIYAYGLRNPWRFTFDRDTSVLWIGDVGQERWEEINRLPRSRAKGANLGWSAWEGRRRFNRRLKARRHVRPIHVYSHEAGCSITAGVVVRDPTMPPRLRDRFLYADFCTGTVRSLRVRDRGAWAVRSEGLRIPAPASFGEDGRRRIYLVSLAGPVYRLMPTG